MGRDDPNRDVYIKGLTLRNTLNLAIVGFGVADLANGVGGVTLEMGVIFAAFSIPTHMLVMRVFGSEMAAG